MKRAKNGRSAPDRPTKTENEKPDASDSSKSAAGSSTSTPRSPWRPLGDLQRATLLQDGRPETSEAVSIPPGDTRQVRP